MRGVRANLLIALLALSVVPGAEGAGSQLSPTGIDVSHWQGHIDWPQVAGAGYSFVFAKATEGVGVQDATYPANRAAAASLGLRVGAYHFARPSGSSDAAVVADAIAEADSFVAYAQPQPGNLRPAVDLEETGGLSPTRLTEWAQAWLAEVVARLGVKPIVYASPHFWQASLADTPVVAAAGDPLWIAHWTAAALPIIPGGAWDGSGWLFWQWSDCQHVPGIAHCVDGDRLNGDSLAPALIGAFATGVPVAEAPPSIVGSLQTGAVIAATPGSWGGGKPVSFTYQWQRCDAAGAACAPVVGATGETYKPTGGDVGHALLVSVTASASAGTATAQSAPTLAVSGTGAAPATAPKPTAPPLIQGTPEAGQTLTATAGAWTRGVTRYAFQWRRCDAAGVCTDISGAGARAYTLTPDDIGTQLAVVVTATGRGGSRSATSSRSAAVAAAPVPTPAVGAAVAQSGQAGAVTTTDGAATVTWQPGAVPAQATVAMQSSSSRLALAGTPLTLGVSATTPLRWPLDVAYATSTPDAVPGFLPGSGVWQPISQLPSPSLPAGQEFGAYRDAAGVLHVLTRVAGRVALFAPGRWGDPRFDSNARPTIALVDNPVATRQGAGVLVRARFTLDSQAHLYASLVTPDGKRVLLPQTGSRLGWWLRGGPTKTFQTLQLRPGAMPIRFHFVPRASGTYTLRLTAIDPYGRHARLIAKVSISK